MPTGPLDGGEIVPPFRELLPRSKLLVADSAAPVNASARRAVPVAVELPDSAIVDWPVPGLDEIASNGDWIDVPPAIENVPSTVCVLP